MEPTSSLTPLNMCLKKAVQWSYNGEKVVLATVIGTWGSAPQPVGGYMVVSSRNRSEGSVSGGCVESDIILNAQEIFDDDPSPRQLSYSAQDRNHWGVGLPCGGKITVMLELIYTPQHPQGTLNIATLKEVLNNISKRIPCSLIRLVNGKTHFCLSQTQLRETKTPLPDAVLNHARQLLENNAHRVIDINGENWFIQSFPPSLRIIIVGAVHIAQALSQLAQFMGYFPIIVDPRSFLLTTQRFPHIEPKQLLNSWPGESIAHLRPDNRTAIVTLSHDKKLDDDALRNALKTDAFFIGALGSKRNQNKRLQRLQDEGFSEYDLTRIQGPVGLDIGSIGAQEISLSIMAQIVATCRHSPLEAK